ncbi:MAG: sugar ABC transporter substrate-binding protein, partial [Oscillospiraceae bacterium]
IEKNIALDEQAIAQGYDGIACIAATADSYIPIVEQAKENGIPVVTFHQDSPESARLAFFGPDHVANAQAEARFMADYLGKKGQVITIQGAASDAESLVVDSFIEELAVYAPEMEVVAVLSDTLDAAKAYEKISAAIEANPEVVGFFGATQRSGSDVATICAEQGMDFSKLCIITNDVVPANVKLLQEGKITAINDQGALDTGYLAVKALYEYLTTGELTTYNYGLNYLPTNLVTAENVDEYLEVNKIIEDMLAAAAQK